MYDDLQVCMDNLGTKFRGHVAVLDCEQCKTRAGSPYIRMTVTDGEIDVACVRWSSESMFTVGSIILIVGESGEYSGSKQFTIQGAQFAPNADKSQFQKKVDYTFIEYCRIQLDQIQDTTLRDIGIEILEDNYEAFAKGAGAVKMHHNEMGGLMKHTSEVLRTSLAIAQSLPYEMHDSMDMDVLRFSAIFHDLGKLFVYSVDEFSGAVSKTEEYYASDHIVGTIQVLSQYFTEHNYENHLIMHCIISHHGKLEWGALKEPASLEAIILHQADVVSAQAVMLYEGHKNAKVTESGWTEGKVFPFGRSVYVKPTEEDRE